MEKIVLIFATNRPNSYTNAVGNIYKAILNQHTVLTEVIDLKEVSAQTHLLNEELFGKRTEAFNSLITEKLQTNTKFIFFIPEYNGSFPGVLKVFLDAIPPATWINKKALLVGISSGRAGNLRGMEHLTGVLNYLKFFVHPNRLPISLIDTHVDFGATSFKTDTQQKVSEDQIKQFLSWN
jgi:NAD(P)H-dependent FMN reductase